MLPFFFSRGLPCLKGEVWGGLSGFPLFGAHERERGRKPAIARPDARLKIAGLAGPGFPSSLKVTSPSATAENMPPNVPFWHIFDCLEAAKSLGEGGMLTAQQSSALGCAWVLFSILVNRVQGPLLGVGMRRRQWDFQS